MGSSERSAPTGVDAADDDGCGVIGCADIVAGLTLLALHAPGRGCELGGVCICCCNRL